MARLFNELLQMKHVKKSDLNEAIKCFKAKHYKACVLILFPMIDARLIRSQENEKGPRPSGLKAAKNLFSRSEPKYTNEDNVFTMLTGINVFTAIKIFFEHGNDFKDQPMILNRNFLSHGMMHGKVKRKDCAMLFFLLYNLTDFLNTL